MGNFAGKKRMRTRKNERNVINPKKAQEAVEAEIIRLWDEDRGAAFKLFYDAYAPRLMGVCRRYLSEEEDAKDTLQETLFKVYQNMTGFIRKGNGALIAWAYRIAVNASVDCLRSKSKVLVCDSLEELEDTLTDPHPDENPGKTDDIPLEVIREMIYALPDGYRTIFNLYAVDGLSHAQIAKLLDIKENTSSSQYYRARKILADKITDWRKEHSEVI